MLLFFDIKIRIILRRFEKNLFSKSFLSTKNVLNLKMLINLFIKIFSITIKKSNSKMSFDLFTKKVSITTKKSNLKITINCVLNKNCTKKTFATINLNMFSKII